VFVSGEKSNSWEIELTGSKERCELGEAKIGGKLLSYFLPPARPDLDQVLKFLLFVCFFMFFFGFLNKFDLVFAFLQMLLFFLFFCLFVLM
jgi:hypothetical protein